jgi:hypothetical protein
MGSCCHEIKIKRLIEPRGGEGSTYQEIGRRAILRI